jgi:hypothetical protein
MYIFKLEENTLDYYSASAVVVNAAMVGLAPHNLPAPDGLDWSS